MLRPLELADVRPSLAPLPGRDCSVSDRFFRAMTGLSRASDEPIHTLHGSIDRFNELRLLWLKKFTDRPRAKKLRESRTMPTLDKRTTREQDRHCAGRPVGKSSDLVSIATVIRGSTTGGRGRMAVGGNKLEQNGEILGSNGFLYPKLKVHVIGEIGTGPV